ncbi:MAG: sucrase ferredoxin [Phormidesmis sp.]
MLKDCQFCSVVSKKNGEDPIGTASTHDYWLLTELPLPWIFENWQKDPLVGRLIQLFERLIVKEGMKLRPLAIAPNTDCAKPGYHRILFYRRPARLFSQYEQQEYLIPTERLYDITLALLQAPERLAEFEPYRQPVSTRALIICTHGNVDVACSRFGDPIYQELREKYASSSLRIWRCSHFGGHRFAPTLIDLPIGQFFGHLESTHLDALIHHRGDWQPLRNCYRGWAGLTPLEQVAEREIWMQLGWTWFDYVKAGKIKKDFGSAPKGTADLATVQIECKNVHGESNIYEIDIERIEDVETASQSGAGMKMEKVKQYRVNRTRVL